MKIVIRPEYHSFDTKRLLFAYEKILTTTYMWGAKYENAPLITDCVTAVRWLLAASSEYTFPFWYIGDLAKMLLDEGARIVPLADARIGDIIFFEKMSLRHKKYMVTHIGLMISPHEFIHSSRAHNGKISRIDDLEYIHNILDESYLPIAKDPRNNSLISWKTSMS